MDGTIHMRSECRFPFLSPPLFSHSPVISLFVPTGVAPTLFLHQFSSLLNWKVFPVGPLTKRWSISEVTRRAQIGTPPPHTPSPSAPLVHRSLCLQRLTWPISASMGPRLQVSPFTLWQHLLNLPWHYHTLIGFVHTAYNYLRQYDHTLRESLSIKVQCFEILVLKKVLFTSSAMYPTNPTEPYWLLNHTNPNRYRKPF